MTPGKSIALVVPSQAITSLLCPGDDTAGQDGSALTRAQTSNHTAPPPPPRPGDALEGKGPQGPRRRRLDRRLEEVAKAVGGSGNRHTTARKVQTTEKSEAPPPSRQQSASCLSGGRSGEAPSPRPPPRPCPQRGTHALRLLRLRKPPNPRGSTAPSPQPPRAYLWPGSRRRQGPHGDSDTRRCPTPRPAGHRRGRVLLLPHATPSPPGPVVGPECLPFSPGPVALALLDDGASSWGGGYCVLKPMSMPHSPSALDPAACCSCSALWSPQSRPRATKHPPPNTP